MPPTLRSAVESELHHLEKLGIMEKVSHSDWATPIVPFIKEDATIKIYGDFNPLFRLVSAPLAQTRRVVCNLIRRPTVVFQHGGILATRA